MNDDKVSETVNKYKMAIYKSCTVDDSGTTICNTIYSLDSGLPEISELKIRK